MRSDQERARKMRIGGYSYQEIHQTLGVPKSTLSSWFSGLLLSRSAQRRINQRVNQGLVNGLVRRNKLQTHLARRRARETRELSAGEVGKLSERELLLIGVALYWAEGYKKSVIKNGKERTFHAISFTNTDPAMVRLFVRFLTEIIHLPQSKIRFHVRLFPHINEDDALRYWLEASGLPEESALKPTVVTSVSSLRKRPFNRLPYGVVQIRACDTKNFYRIMGWIDGIKQFVTV